MPAKNDASRPRYSNEILNYRAQLEAQESLYKTSQGRKRYLAGSMANQYRQDILDLEFGIHRPVRFARNYMVCVCGLEVPSGSLTERFPEYLKTPGHLDANHEPTSVFYYFKRVAPQYQVLHVVCQVCDSIEEVTPRETTGPDAPATHHCDERKTLNDNYLSSNILIGYANGTTWLLSDEQPKNDSQETQPQTTTFVITACDPRSEKATLHENHVNTLALEQDLKRNGLEYYIGWGRSDDKLHSELSFCVPVPEPEALDATRHLLTELAKDYEQNAIFEITGTEVRLVPCLDPNAIGLTTKFASKIAEPQSHFRQMLNSLRWMTEITPEDLDQLDALIEEKTKDA